MFPPTWFAAWMNHRRAKIGLRNSGIAEALVMSRGYGRAPLSAVAAGGRSEACVTLVAPADRRLADESVSRRSGAAGGARDDLPVVVGAAAGRAAEGADPVPPIAPHGPSAARGTSGQWPGPTAKRGQHQRPSRRGGRSRRARALGRRPPARTRQQRDRDAR